MAESCRFNKRITPSPFHSRSASRTSRSRFKIILQSDQDLNDNNRKDIMDGEDQRLEVRNCRFYFVKLREFRNPDLVQAEELLDLQFAISQAREEQLLKKNRLQSTLQNPSYYNIQNWNFLKDGLRTLRLCIDNRIGVQLGTHNNNSKEATKEAKRCIFTQLHGCNNLAKERKAVKQKNEASAHPNPYWGDYNHIMERLEFSLERTSHDPCNKRGEVRQDIRELRRAKEEALENVGCHRVEQPESSVSGEEVEKKIKDAIELLEERRDRLMEHNNEFTLIKEKLQAVEQDLLISDKQLVDLKVILCSYRSLPEWRKQHQEENACHDENVSLLRHAGKLADEKDTAALGRLSKGQVEAFMVSWNKDVAFRSDYQRRAHTSLNSRGLCTDGRTKNPNEEMIACDGPRIKLPNRIRKLLTKNRPPEPT